MQTLTEVQGLIACIISARAVRVWATDTAKFVHASTQSWVGGNSWKLRGTLVERYAAPYDVYRKTFKVLCTFQLLSPTQLWMEAWTNFAVLVAQTLTAQALILQP